MKVCSICQVLKQGGNITTMHCRCVVLTIYSNLETRNRIYRMCIQARGPILETVSVKLLVIVIIVFKRRHRTYCAQLSRLRLSLSSKKMLHMQLYLLSCCFPRVTRLKSADLNQYTFNQFPIRFKTRSCDEKPQTIDVLSPVFATFSHNRLVENASCFYGSQLNVG